MGYTINSVILAMKLKSIKFILITTFKNLIIILGTIILILISINYIKEILSREKKVEFTRLFNECTKEEIVVTFLSILEMSKDNLITLSQNKNFSKIYVEVYNE